MNRFRLTALFLFAFSVNAMAQEALSSEEQFKDYFQKNGNDLDQIEGIWKVITIQEYYHLDTLYEIDKIPKSVKVAILKKGNDFESFNLTGEPYDVLFSTSEIRGVYFYKNFFPETGEYSKANAVISKSGEMEYNYDFPENYMKKKLGDSYEDGTRVVNKTKWVKVFPQKKK